jgi:hypothetical protein
MRTHRLTEAELDAAIADRAQPYPYCTGACDQGRAECTCETGMPPMLPMWDVEAERPRLSAALCALAIIGTIAVCALSAGCGGSDDDEPRRSPPADCVAHPEKCPL